MFISALGTYLIILALCTWMGAFSHSTAVCRIIILKQTQQRNQPKAALCSKDEQHLCIPQQAESILTKLASRIKVLQSNNFILLSHSLIDSPNVISLTHCLCTSLMKIKTWDLKFFSQGTQLWVPKSWFSKGKITCRCQKTQSSVVNTYQLWYSRPRTDQ